MSLNINVRIFEYINYIRLCSEIQQKAKFRMK